MGSELQIFGACAYTHEDIVKVIEHISNKKTEIGTIVTQVYKFADIHEAFEQALTAKGTIKISSAPSDLAGVHSSRIARSESRGLCVILVGNFVSMYISLF
ncbi:hypothetical protein X809_28700 [Paenibacillus polymyxa CR1]|nr:hypothetical protein X809_28700 [Paenibacillus polymyxa CR1]OMF70324.1 hypothetical protein BK143_17575 [Paenibacillus peoriae]OMF81250.1 hypothetical protein BK145_07445 [Paenibacillus peoriae]